MYYAFCKDQKASRIVFYRKHYFERLVEVFPKSSLDILMQAIIIQGFDINRWKYYPVCFILAGSYKGFSVGSGLPMKLI